MFGLRYLRGCLRSPYGALDEIRQGDFDGMTHVQDLRTRHTIHEGIRRAERAPCICEELLG